MKVHPAAELFPMLSDERLKDLAEDIRGHGLRQPIATWNGFLIDGRNREAACKLAGVRPRYEELAGTENDALEFIASTNLQRRDLSQGVRAAIVAQMSDLIAETRAAADKHRRDTGRDAAVAQWNGSRSRDPNPSDPIHVDVELAKKADVSPSTMKRVRRAQREDPDLFAKVAKGETTPGAAQKILTERNKEQPARRPRATTPTQVKHLHEVMLRLEGSANAISNCDVAAAIDAADEIQLRQWRRSLRSLGSALTPLRAALDQRKTA